MADDSISLDVLVEGIHIAGSPFQVAVERGTRVFFLETYLVFKPKTISDEKVPFEKAPQENPCDELVVVSGANSDMYVQSRGLLE